MAQRPDEASEQPEISDGVRSSDRPTGDATRRLPPSAKPGPPTWIAMSGLGFEFVAAVLVPGAAGWWADRMFGTGPWIMLAGGLLGFVVGLRLLMRSVNGSPKT